jgi:hypothetical protein
MAHSDNVSVQQAWIALLKSFPTVVAELANADQIKELQWQGTDFVYPGIRVGVDYMPSINGCGTDKAEITIEIHAEDKSSKKCTEISALILNLIHKHIFTEPTTGLRFPIVVVKKVSRPIRTVYQDWVSKLDVSVDVI